MNATTLNVNLIHMSCNNLDAPPPSLVGVALIDHLHECPIYDNFRRTIEATFDGSLDAPGVSGMSIDKILANFRSQGAPRACGWFMFLEDATSDAACGVLLLGDPRPCWPQRLQYMGVVPAARGRGLGAVLCRWAFYFARHWASSALDLWVDAENLPARRCYAAAGFIEGQRKLVEVPL